MRTQEGVRCGAVRRHAPSATDKPTTTKRIRLRAAAHRDVRFAPRGFICVDSAEPFASVWFAKQAWPIECSAAVDSPGARVIAKYLRICESESVFLESCWQGKMRLLRAALVTLFVVGSEVLAAPVAAVAIGCCGDRDRDQDRIDPLQSEDSFSDDVSRTKRKFKPEDMEAANLVINRSLEQQRQKRQQTASVKRARQATNDGDDDPDGAENEVDGDGSENGPFGQDGKVTLQIPGKLFGNATNLVLAVAKIFGDFLTNTAIRSARFLQLFQPLFGRNLYIQIPKTTTESNEV